MENNTVLGNLIVQVANSYIGQQEIGNNQGWKDKVFEQKMIDIGWQKGWSWCALFYKLCLKEALEKFYPIEEKAIIKTILKYYSPSVLKTWKALSQLNKTTQVPIIGAAVVWQTGNSTGHMGILSVLPKDNLFYDIEGNTSAIGSQSNGDQVMTKKRNTKSTDRFKLLGFINPMVL